MLNSHKLLYILPDVAYIAELLPTKKEHTFTIQTFRQINGEFIDDNDFIAENIKKLIGKLDPEEYHLILPDFLFTNTIVEVAETDETKVIKYLKETLLPELTLSTETHELKTFVLTNHGGKSKVQLSALEKSLMNPISENVEEKGVKIKAISPLSWTLKSIISLEPSISIIQMGAHVYLTQHYIGIDQAMSATVDDVANLSETIKTLKGAEPSIQTVYLIANQLVEEKLKENLSDTLPLQQLASFSEEDSEMPSYVKFGIEAGMKTLSLDAFPVPKFPLPKPTEAQKAAVTDVKTDEPDTSDEKEEMKPTDDTKALDTDLPKPAAAPVVEPVVAAAATAVPTPVNELSLDSESESTDSTGNNTEELSEPTEPEPVKPEIKEDAKTDEPVTAAPEEKSIDSADDEDTALEIKVEKIVSSTVSMKKEEQEAEKPKEEPKKSGVIKNQSGLQPMLKMLGISFLVFLVTVGIGVGVGRAFIYFTQQGNETTETPIASATPATSEEPTPSPSPSPKAEIDVSKLSVLVVNATTKAGYAGTTKDALDEADFGKVNAGNAKGDYEKDGTIVLMEEEDAALIDLLEETLNTTLTFKEGADIEDAQGTYDAIIVLTE